MRKIIIVILAIVCISLFACRADISTSQPQDEDSVVKTISEEDIRYEHWSEDIDILGDALKMYQVDYKEYYTENELDEYLEMLKSKIDDSTDNEMVFELKKLVASFDDSHSYIPLPLDYLSHQLPMKFTFIDGSLHCVNASSDYESVLYSKILKFGDYDVNYVVNKLLDYSNSENEYGRRHGTLTGLRLMDVLTTLGFTSSNEFVTITFEDPETKKEKSIDVMYETLSEDKGVEYLKSGMISTHVSGLDNYFEKPFWYEYDPSNKLFVFTVVRWIEFEKGDFRAFFKDMWDFVDNHDVETFVMDVRYNSGGYTEFVHMFRKGALARKDIFNPDNFYVFTGNDTNSCGVISAADMMRYNLATIVGEPTRGAPNTRHSGIHTQLKHSGLELFLSSGMTSGYPGYDYETLIPDVMIERNLKDYMSETDPLIEFVIKESKL